MTALVRVRVWLSDRPGALGAVASRIGSVGGDVVGVEILERGGGRAVDDLIVELPDSSLTKLLVNEIQEVDGVDVEDVVPVTAAVLDPDVSALEAASELVLSADRGSLVARLADIALRIEQAQWAAIVDVSEGALLARVGDAPNPEWVAAFAVGSATSSQAFGTNANANDVISSPLRGTSLVLLVGRDGHAFRARERRRCDGLAAIAAARLAGLLPVE